MADGATTITDAIVDTTVDATTAATDAIVEPATVAADYIAETGSDVADTASTSVAETANETAAAVTEFVTEDAPQWLAENESQIDVLKMASGAGVALTGVNSAGGTLIGGGALAAGVDGPAPLVDVIVTLPLVTIGGALLMRDSLRDRANIDTGSTIDTGYAPELDPNSANQTPPATLENLWELPGFPQETDLDEGIGGFSEAPKNLVNPSVPGFGEDTQDLTDLVPPFFEAKSSSDPFGQIPFDVQEAAAELGYDKRIPPYKAPFNSHGQQVFSNGKGYITRDIDSHNGGIWKKFDRKGRRVGTYDENLDQIGK